MKSFLHCSKFSQLETKTREQKIFRFVRESASSYEVSTGDGEAISRTQRKRARRYAPGEIPRTAHKNKTGHHLVSENTGISPLANIRSLAAYERARRALRGVCEPSDFVAG